MPAFFTGEHSDIFTLIKNKNKTKNKIKSVTSKAKTLNALHKWNYENAHEYSRQISVSREKSS